MRSFAVAASVALALSAAAAAAEDLRTAVFAGGCFWCVEADFDKVPGVEKTVSGYTGGDVENPSYKQVTYEDTGHFEAVEITYDAEQVSYEELLRTFWRTVDPLDPAGQFCDKGPSYRTAVFVADEAQRAAAEASKAEAEQVLGKEVVIEIRDAGTFWRAEEYHQNYYKKSPVKYTYYRWRCGRDARVEELWGDEAFAGMVKED
ncbi:MAG TPA: peptide-methionine (S)-S-oxide reductase MsrA [Thermohalobaculum sp.]|nr:peptide-methionine (S)-S-oxide reductase MsrA [Thermohalobaculum sp.]